MIRALHSTRSCTQLGLWEGEPGKGNLGRRTWEGEPGKGGEGEPGYGSSDVIWQEESFHCSNTEAICKDLHTSPELPIALWHFKWQFLLWGIFNSEIGVGGLYSFHGCEDTWGVDVLISTSLGRPPLAWLDSREAL